MLPKGMSTKTMREKLPPWRAVLGILGRARFWFVVILTVIVITTFRSFGSQASNMQKFYCFGPAKPPMELTPNEIARWHAHQQTPVIFNQHKPIEINATSITMVDLNAVSSSRDAAKNRERILILTPLRDAAVHLYKHFELLMQLSYPHDLIDLGFLVSDSTDDTLAILAKELDRIQNSPDPKTGGPFNSVMVIKKDFGINESMDVEVRHSFEFQGPRRKSIAKARNFLLTAALKPEHSWVYWRDVDVVEHPARILEDFTAHDKDIVVPNIWFHRYDNAGRDIEGKFDYNSWVESEQGLKLASTLPKDTVLAEGYDEYKTGRKYLVAMGDWRKPAHEEVELDGIGGVSIMVKADVHRAGINFPAYAFENQAETEGFAKMAKRAGYQVIGLPNYVVWHIDTDEKQHLKDRKAY